MGCPRCRLCREDTKLSLNYQWILSPSERQAEQKTCKMCAKRIPIGYPGERVIEQTDKIDERE
jgi:hypothetical protein